MSDRLTNEYLEVHLADPGDLIGARFDRTGFVTQVRLMDGGHTFCVPESLIPGSGTGGVGLCNEFGIFSPIGYENAATGDTFPKIGVGLLTRPDAGNYAFSRTYPVEPFPLDVYRGEREIRYVIHPLPCRGYAVRLEKNVRLKDATLLIEYALHNMGTHRIQTHEYAHNFMAVNEYPIGPDYALKFGSSTVVEYMEPEFTPETLEVTPKEIRWRKMPQRSFYCTLRQAAESDAYFWELLHKPSGVRVRESGDFETDRMALWGLSHVVSPEVFVSINVAPGECMFWTRKYEFFAGGA